MKKIFAQGDLSGWLSPDEELLLNLFRESGSYEREQMLFQYALKRLACMFADETDSLETLESPENKEALERWLLLHCPIELLDDCYQDEPNKSELINTAWESVASVILGLQENDGKHADELFNASIRLWDMMKEHIVHQQKRQFSRQRALAFIEAWRDRVITFAFESQRGGSS
tara:strand:+ start:740 stop:1258 length:519 start_codon:yes stop_codon:yes gene_type:complete